LLSLFKYAPDIQQGRATLTFSPEQDVTDLLVFSVSIVIDAVIYFIEISQKEPNLVATHRRIVELFEK
jgi:hypothetical protein